MQVLNAVEATLHDITRTVAPASKGQRKGGSSGSADSSIDEGASGAAGKRPSRSGQAAKDYSFSPADAAKEAKAVFSQLFEGSVLWDERVRFDDIIPDAMHDVMREVRQPACCSHSLAARYCACLAVTTL